MEQPLSGTAVVIPCFNLGRLIAEAVESVVAQTCPASEIVVVDDGSTDVDTHRALDRIEAPRVRVCRQPHLGPGAARNCGVSQTSSRYLLFLDGDDVLEEEYLQRTCAMLDQEPTLDFVSTAVRGFGEASYVWTPPPCALSTALTRGTIPITALMRRRVWETLGGFDTTLPTSMDLDFWIRAMEHEFSGTILDEPLLLQRVRPGSLHQQAVSRRTHLPVLTRILASHRQTVVKTGTSLLVAKEQYLQEQRNNRRDLERRRAELDRQLHIVDARIRDVRTWLEQTGVDAVNRGDFRRSTTFSPIWGLDRGQPVDRYYIEHFLRRHRADIRGRVLEMKDAGYTRWFGGDAVSGSEVLDVDPLNTDATMIADLSAAETIPDESFDCFILTQTLHLIYDVEAAVSHAFRILRPGSVLLATLPAVTRVDYEDDGIDGDHWRFTESAVRELFSGPFAPENVEIEARGNRKACGAFIYGLASQDLSQAEIDTRERASPLIFCVRAVKHGSSRIAMKRPPRTASPASPRGVAGILMYHRVADMDPDPHGLGVSPAEFRGHLEYVAERYRIVPLEALAQAVSQGTVPNECIAVTLDDGTIDALETASDILVELGIPATFFITTHRLQEAHEPWWTTLARIMLTDQPTPSILTLDLADGQESFSTRDRSERAKAYFEIHRALIRATLDERDRAMAALTAWSDRDLSPRQADRLLLAHEIRKLGARPGHSIGAHSVHHLLLPAQPSDVQAQEVARSRQHLEAVLGRAVTLFSYPYGSRDEHVIARVRDAGYAAAVSTRPGAVRAGSDLYDLPRLDVKNVGVMPLAESLAGMLGTIQGSAS
ncbi:MAG: glycosyltransferase [Acidobacteriota bacterium]